MKEDKLFFFEHCDKFMSQSEMKIYFIINTFKFSVERGDNSYIVFHIFNPAGIALTAFLYSSESKI